MGYSLHTLRKGCVPNRVEIGEPHEVNPKCKCLDLHPLYSFYIYSAESLEVLDFEKEVGKYRTSDTSYLHGFDSLQ